MTPKSLTLSLVTALALLATPALAARTRVWSLQGLDGGDTGDALARWFTSVPGVRHARFELYSSELTLEVDDAFKDASVAEVLARSGRGWRAVPGPGQGRYLPPLDYPPGADVAVLTRTGAAVGPLERLRAPNRTTIFDVYADWCIACRPLDANVRDFVRTHHGVAVRKLNLARWDSPLARELGPRLTALPHVIVITPDGRRHEFDGNTWPEIAKAMRW
jgi:thiol-disulfide isomerase/thioredoxin